MENNITSIEQLKSYTQGSVIELPSFGEGQPFFARLVRPSLLNMVKCGKIPNSLLNSASLLFEKGPARMIETGNKEDDDEIMEKMFGIIDVICEASFVEPKYSDIKQAGIELTDDQMLFVFNYAQNGVKALESFR